MVTRVLNRLVAACVLGAAVGVGSAAPAAAATTASLSPASGPPGGSVTVSGTGFDPSARVDLFFDTTDTARAVSNASGGVSISVQIPKSAQPGAHWITLDEAHGNRAAQAQFTVAASWPQGGYGPSERSFNPVENTVDVSNANQLVAAWSRLITPAATVKPFVVFNGNAYVFDESGVLHAYSPTGSVLWTADVAARPTGQIAPAASDGRVYVATVYGVVFAFSYLCRTDGGLCTTPLWHTGIGSQASAGLTVRNGLLYVPMADGLVHVLNATTGAPGTSIVPGTGSGPVTQPISFGVDGTTFIVRGSSYSVNGPNGSNNGELGGRRSRRWRLAPPKPTQPRRMGASTVLSPTEKAAHRSAVLAARSRRRWPRASSMRPAATPSVPTTPSPSAPCGVSRCPCRRAAWRSPTACCMPAGEAGFERMTPNPTPGWLPPVSVRAYPRS